MIDSLKHSKEKVYQDAPLSGLRRPDEQTVGFLPSNRLRQPRFGSKIGYRTAGM